ncbi:MAG: class I SAM-dependent methyltransferase [Alphaproteobacteria bacterium]
MNIEKQITDHYARKGKTEIADTNQHLHIGGLSATEFVLKKLDIQPGMRVLDIGCGVGGPALYAAEIFGCHVSGIDLTPDFIDTAKELAQQKGLVERTNFICTSGDDLPFENDYFDAGFMFHVGMNIPDKFPVYEEAARVLKSGAQFLIYDVMALENAADMIYPCPWAKTVETSFLETPEVLQTYLHNAGFEIISSESSQDYALSALNKMLQQTNWSETPERHTAMRNLYDNIKNNTCAPHVIVAKNL